VNGMGLPAWAANTAYVVGTRVTKVADDNSVWLVETAGTSGNTEPTWPTTAPWTVTDGGVSWGLASSFRRKCVVGINTVLTDFVAANPTLVRSVRKSRPKSLTNTDLPCVWLGVRREVVTHGSQIRQTTLTVPVSVAVPVPDNAEAELLLDDILDGLRDAFTLNYHAASGFAISAQEDADEADEPEGATPYLVNTIAIVNTIGEGHQ
jgi:hypothetical protein